MTQDILRHLWRPQTIPELARGTGYSRVAIRGALFTLRLAGLAKRQPTTRLPRNGTRWAWVRV